MIDFALHGDLFFIAARAGLIACKCGASIAARCGQGNRQSGSSRSESARKASNGDVRLEIRGRRLESDAGLARVGVERQRQELGGDSAEIDPAVDDLVGSSLLAGERRPAAGLRSSARQELDVDRLVDFDVERLQADDAGLRQARREFALDAARRAAIWRCGSAR